MVCIENGDNYAFLMPVLKALMDKAHALLTIEHLLPNLPQTTRSPTFFDDFHTYCKTEEWNNFMLNYVCQERDLRKGGKYQRDRKGDKKDFVGKRVCKFESVYLFPYALYVYNFLHFHLCFVCGNCGRECELY